MAPEDVHKTAFRVLGAVGLFEYLVMTFGLKNAGATYKRAMNYIFHDLIGKLVEIYIDDVVVKSTSAGGHLEDLRQVLEQNRDQLEESGSCKDNEAAYYEERFAEAHRQNQLCQTIYLQSVWAHRAVHGFGESQV